MAPKAKRDGEAQYILKGIDRALWRKVRAAADAQQTTVKALVLAFFHELVKDAK